MTVTLSPRVLLSVRRLGAVTAMSGAASTDGSVVLCVNDIDLESSEPVVEVEACPLLLAQYMGLCKRCPSSRDKFQRRERE